MTPNRFPGLTRFRTFDALSRGMPSSNRVRELVDREEIRDLPVRYCDCLWRKDVDGLLGLFADDATFVIEGIVTAAVARAGGF
jgi:ketosteroid isomerase-like protein